MTPVIPCSVGNVTLFARATLSPRKEIQLTKCSVHGKSTKSTLSPRRFMLPQSLSLRVFQKYRRGCDSKCVSRNQILAAVGTDVATEEPNPAVSDADDDKVSESPPASTETNETSSAGPTTVTPTPTTVTPTAQSKRLRPVRKSAMPPVNNEELVPGASFTGKVRSIQPFGAFVDFGAFTDGLVHVSKMSDEFVKDVGSIVSVGQEVKVRIVEANMETGRISLTMRDSDDVNNDSNDKPRTVRKNTSRSNQKRDVVQKISKFVKGQVLDGTVKNLTRAGAFVSLPEGEEGFLPTSEESEGFSILGSSSLQIGQEVNVRVLRITRGQVTLTMKKEEDMKGLNMKLNQGVVHVATNPFELAFRKNKDIAAFLEERERLPKSAETLVVSKTEQIDGKVDETVSRSDALEVEDSILSSDKDLISVPSASDIKIEDYRTTSEEQSVEATLVDSISSELVSVDEKPENTFSGSLEIADSSLETLSEEESSSKTSASEESVSPTDSVKPEASVMDEAEEPGAETETVEEDDTNSKTMLSEITGSATKLVVDEASTVDGEKENGSASETIKEDKLSSKTTTSEENGSDADSVIGEVFTADGLKDTNSGTDPSGQIRDETIPSEGVLSEEVVKNHSDDTLVDDEVGSEAPLLVENETTPAASKDVTVTAPSNTEKGDNGSSIGQTGIRTQESLIKATVSPALVKQLREETGAGMMDCKKALAETGCDIIKAQEFLRKKGLASADKKASRATAEGRIGSYIHDNRIGVLIEVNCETDFVSRGDIFKQLVDDLAMQVAACPQVQYLVTEDVPEEIVSKEREIEMQKEDLLIKPEQIRSKIVDGRIRKRLEEFALLEQPYIKNDKMVVKDWVKQAIATIGENIKVRRFIRINLGEGLEKKSQDFSAEVAAQTAAKSSPMVQKDQPAEAEENIEKAPTVTVSAALVKQLREETGAGMMDCKKALIETGGNLEKAQEFLRKKGLSSADKKSSRLAAEGRISSYIHDSRIGVLLEVNCETDFVGRSEKFKELVDDLAMQVVACPQVEFVSVEEIPESVVSKEREIEMQREDLKSKPDNIREKIVEGRVSKRLGELALLEQPFVRDDGVLVKDLVKQTVAALGENIRVRRFVRFTLGESKD